MEKIVGRLRELLKEGRELSAESVRASFGSSEDPPDAPSRTYWERVQTWVLNGRNTLDFAGLGQYAAYFNDIELRGGFRPGASDDRIAALASAISQIEAGFIGNIRHLLHADIFDSMIEQAGALLADGHTIPAAVLGRIVVERWLRDQAEAAAIPNHDAAKAAALNDALKNAGRYSVAKWRQIQAHLDVGNSAAHGEAADVTTDTVRLLLEYARANCV